MHRRGVLLLITGIVFVIGDSAVIGMLGWSTYEQFPDQVHLLAPGKATIQASKPGTYILWNDYETSFNGHNHADSRSVPQGWNYTLREDSTGQSLPLNPSTKYSLSVNIGAKHRNSQSVGTIQLTQPGAYTFVIEGPGPPRVFSLGFSPFTLVGAIFLATVPAILCWPLGLILLAVGIAQAVRPANVKKFY